MKIGVDSRSLEYERTGIARYLVNLLKQWADIADYNSYHIYYFEKEPRDEFFNKGCFKKIKLRYEIPFENGPFYKELKQNPVDVFFSPLYDLPRELNNIPAVITVHDMVYEAYPESFMDVQLEYLRTTTDYSISSASKIITISEFSKSEIIKYYPNVIDKISVIYNGVAPFFKKIDISAEAFKIIQKKYGICYPFFFYTGIISEKRHIPDLIEAFMRFSSKNPCFQVLISGRSVLLSGENIDEIVDSCNKNKQIKPIVYVKYLPEDDLLLFYNKAMAFVYLSEYEGFGFPPLEAMACETPVITTNLTSIPEVTGDAALKVNPSDKYEIEKALQEISLNKALRQKLIEEGKKRVSLFTYTDCALKTIRVIEGAGKIPTG